MNPYPLYPLHCSGVSPMNFEPSYLNMVGDLLEILGDDCLPSEIVDRVRALMKERDLLLAERQEASNVQ